MRVITERDAADLGAKAGFRANTIVLLGDSISLSGTSNIASNVEYWKPEGWWHWCNEVLGQRFNQIYNAGISGENTTQILARVGLVIAKRPEYCLVHCGINDVQQGVALSVIQDNLRLIYRRLTDAGIKVIAMTTISSGSAGGQLDSAGKKLVLFQLQRWIAQYGRDAEGIYVVEWHRVLQDATTGLSLTGYTMDGTHPNTLGGSRLGQHLAREIALVAEPIEMLPASNADTDNEAKNPMMTGTGGTTSGTITNTGAIAASLIFEPDSGTITTSSAKVARTDQIGGEWQQVTIASGGGDFKARITEDLIATMGLAVGDTVEMVCEYETDAAGWTGNPGIGLYLQALNGFTAITGTVSIVRSMWLQSLTTTESYERPPGGIMKTVPLVIPATTTRLMGWFFFFCSGSRAGTVRMGRNGLYKVVTA